MALLNFKYGVHAKLPSQITNGTVYITTDEKAMYVDLNNERIRLSNIITLKDVTEWQALKPPYNTEAFYYIADANALLRCSGTKMVDGKEVGNWVQINSLGDLPERMLAEEAYTKELKETILPDINAALAALRQKDEQLDNFDDAITLSLDNLYKVVGCIGSGSTLPDKSTCNPNDLFLLINADGSAVLKIVKEYTLADGETKTRQWEDYTNTDLAGRIEFLTEKVSKMAENGELNTFIETATARFEAIEKRLDDDEAAIEGLQTDLEEVGNTADSAHQLATSNKDTIENDISPKLTKAQEDIVAINADLQTKQAAIEANAKAAKDAHDAANAAQGTANQAVADAKAAQDTADQAVADAKAANDNANTRVLQSAYDEKMGSLDAKDAALEKAIGDAIKKAEDELASRMQEADAMQYIGTVAKAEDLPTSGMKVGYTYKSVGEFDYNPNADTTIKVYVGDLLIANGTEDEELLDAEGNPNESFGYITSDLVWDVVPSGYIADYNPEMGVTKMADNSAMVHLTSGAPTEEGDLGKITIETDAASALTLTTTADKLVIGMAWTSFDA